jgi:hypothetical protein
MSQIGMGASLNSIAIRNRWAKLGLKGIASVRALLMRLRNILQSFFDRVG